MSGCVKHNEFKSGSVTFTADDGVVITGDLYVGNPKSAPFILLFHMADSSRGEYGEIAPKLIQMGYNCLAIDQRSGKACNLVNNATRKSAIELKKEIEFTDVYLDIEGALEFARNNLEVENVIVWGSSYSSSLIFILAAKHPDEVQGVLSFSPGEYFTYQGKTIEEYASAVKVPVFITSAFSESGDWRNIMSRVPGEKKVSFLPKEGGSHGSSALNSINSNNNEYWKAVSEFLVKYFPIR